MTQEQEEREGHQRFARMFEGIDDSSDEEGGILGKDVGEKDANIEKEGKGCEKEGRIVV